ncbi:MAG: type II toxin-antitoxin system VapC family toxin [Euryarchaeota archaeon]|nr:type II toxin-antitoxin system VapC family toxin [Euryarchaeota archaeon]MDE1836114.1 type II toxin-antitoxin system VapC family toxin [Euryarchaeota archaeon]MDE1879404.1 type II toxin-antitoxin system VapC family toxin [Euryarchaeota archaeon]MDE2044092.1 type II toxin-antitoxin system VapC family toxin [Thermoplasmata archaeon]
MSGISALLDTNVFIAARSPDERHYLTSKAVLDGADEGRFTAVISTVTLIEVGVGYLRAGTAELRKQFMHHVQTSPNFRVVPVDVAVADAAAIVRHESSLKLPDAVLVATARQEQASWLVTHDDRISKLVKNPGVISTDRFLREISSHPR